MAASAIEGAWITRLSGQLFFINFSRSNFVLLFELPKGASLSTGTFTMILADMDEGEMRLSAGDVVIQRGTRGAWANRADQPRVVAFVMIDALPLE